MNTRAGGVQMGPALEASLKRAGMSDVLVTSLKAAMLHSGVDISSQTYANAMALAFDEYALRGVQMQVSYMLLYMRRWQGDEARAHKAALKKWAEQELEGGAA